METIDTALLTAGAAVLVLGIAGGWIRDRFWLSEPLFCLLLGALLGPSVTGIVPAEMLPGRVLVEALAHITLGIVVMEAALQLPFGYLHRNLGAMAVVLLIAMPLSWLTAAALASPLLGMGLLPALILGAVLAPTDPVLAASVVRGKQAEDILPKRTRTFLTAESGANDGLGQVMLMLPLLLLSVAPSQALGEWVVGVVLWDTVAAVLIGLVVGDIAGWLMVWAMRRDNVEPASTTTIALALTVTVLAAVELAGSGSILAVFAAGLAFKRYASSEQTLHAHVQESISRFFTLPFFLVLGAELPWGDWWQLGWPALVFAVAVAVLRRLPWFWLLCRFMAPVQARREALFLGFFGPIGSAAIYYALRAEDQSALELWPIASLTVAVSAVIHGVSTTPAMWWFARQAPRDDVETSAKALSDT